MVRLGTVLILPALFGRMEATRAGVLFREGGVKKMPAFADFSNEDRPIGAALCGLKIPSLAYCLAMKYVPFNKKQLVKLKEIESMPHNFGLEDVRLTMQSESRLHLVPEDGKLEFVAWLGKKSETGESDTVIWRFTPPALPQNSTPHPEVRQEEPDEYIIVNFVAAQTLNTRKIFLQDGLVELQSGVSNSGGKGWRDMWEEPAVVERVKAAQQLAPGAKKTGAPEAFKIGQYIGHKANKLWTKYGLGEAFRQIADQAKAENKKQHWVMAGLSHGAALAEVISLRWDIELNPLGQPPTNLVYAYLFNGYKTMNYPMGSLVSKQLATNTVHFISAEVERSTSRSGRRVKVNVRADAVPGFNSDRYNVPIRYLLDDDGLLYQCKDTCPEDVGMMLMGAKALQRILDLHRNSAMMPRLAELVRRCPAAGGPLWQPMDVSMSASVIELD